MIALVVLALVLSMVYGVLLSTLRARETVEQVLAPVTVAPALAALVEGDLAAAFLTADNEKTACFIGKDRAVGLAATDRVDFVAARTVFDPETKQAVDMSELGYQLQENADHRDYFRLYRRQAPGVDDKPTTGGPLVAIYELVKSMDIQYSDGQNWVDGWDSKEKKGLPRAVKFVCIVGILRPPTEGTDPTIEDRTVTIFAPLSH